MPNKKCPLYAGVFFKKFAADFTDTSCLSAFGVLQNFQMILQAKQSECDDTYEHCLSPYFKKADTGVSESVVAR